ncbi:MAG: ATP-binding protein [Deferribacteres bacterium]|nr:ATP-binding protein [candidate division KSB1 bacterium]MCB9503695.1 ATP-binding protein [Deferribacteres bacterium]
MAKKVNKYQLKIPSSTNHLELIREFVTNLARDVGFDDERISQIELAVDEACTNVVKHAYKGDDRQPLDVLVKTDPKKFKIIISDKGKGFNPKLIKTPDMKKYLTEMRVGGLGIYLMQTLMDEVDFKIEPGKRNQVQLVKYIPQ